MSNVELNWPISFPKWLEDCLFLEYFIFSSIDLQGEIIDLKNYKFMKEFKMNQVPNLKGKINTSPYIFMKISQT